MHQNLMHVVAELCDDPDCEMHHIEVGIEEETVSETDLAFFLAGAQAMRSAIIREWRANGCKFPRPALDACLVEAEASLLLLADPFTHRT